MSSRQFDAIDERVAEEIRALHRRHPKLGHHGLLEALRQADIDVDPEELERFMKEHGIKPEKPWRPWRWRGLPVWLGGSAAVEQSPTGGADAHDEGDRD